MLRDLEKLEQPFLAPEGGELEIYFDDIGDSHERIWDMLENYKEVVEALEETNESYISHRVNDILRVLTSISVIVLPLTLIASIWGMNVGVPGEGDTADFYVIVGAMVVLLLGMVAYFRAAAALSWLRSDAGDILPGRGGGTVADIARGRSGRTDAGGSTLGGPGS